MTKRHMIKPLRKSLGADACGGAVWSGVGRQLRRRRTELGFDVEHVARRVGTSANSFAGYETGAPIPASVLAQIADLFGVPVVWFFQGVGHEEPAARGETSATDPVVYTVATAEHRAQALVDYFRKLDLEGQQHLLAISAALTRADANTAPD